MTNSQQRALTNLWPRFGIDFSKGVLDLDEVFGRSALRVLDIGFGDGEALVSAAANYPDIDYLGIEVHEPGIGHALIALERARLSNVRVINRDAVEVIDTMLPPTSFDAVNLFFPDPWPKKRHHKRRLIQPDFADELTRVLKPGGLLHIATDWHDYAHHVGSVLESASGFISCSPDANANAADPLAFRPPTKFERRGRRLGHDVYDLYFRRRITAAPVPDRDAARTEDRSASEEPVQPPTHR